MNIKAVFQFLSSLMWALVWASAITACGGGDLSTAGAGDTTGGGVVVKPANTLHLLAGAFGGSGAIDGVGSAARFLNPHGIAVDNRGSVYVVDSESHTIRKITSDGVVTTLAGFAGQWGSTDGSGSAARFQSPQGLAVDGSGTVYVADSYNNSIRRITPDGAVTTLAGRTGQRGGADGRGSEASFSHPYGLAVDGQGNVYVTDVGVIRKITREGLVTTLAGLAGETGNVDGTGSVARFSSLGGIAVDSRDNIYVTDSTTIRKITPEGVVTTWAGRAGESGSADGHAGEARFGIPIGIAVDNRGDVYVADSGIPGIGSSNHTIRKITSEGLVTTLAGSAGHSGSADGIGSAARFNWPKGVVVDSRGSVYVADSYFSTIRKITPQGVVTTLAGSAGERGSADGTGSAARLGSPSGMAVDSSGTVYVSDRDNSTIRKITPQGVVTTLAGSAGERGSADGTGSAARLGSPSGMAVDSSGNLYVGDTGNNTIRKVSPGGAVTTLAGLAGQMGRTDGIGSAARFTFPQGVGVDRSGNIYVADPGASHVLSPYPRSNTIRKITPEGVVTTLAGSAGERGGADGTGSAARFDNPNGIAIDSNGTVYVTDTGNNTIRKITPEGVVTTLAGSAGERGSADGTGSTARFDNPNGIAIDSSGTVYVADTGNNTIRKITPDGVVSSLVINGLPNRNVNRPRALAVSGDKLYVTTENAVAWVGR